MSIDVAASGPRGLRIRVADDGAGLKAGWREGLGLRGMSERAGALGGNLTLRAGGPGGAVLEAWLPMEPLGIRPRLAKAFCPPRDFLEVRLRENCWNESGDHELGPKGPSTIPADSRRAR